MPKRRTVLKYGLCTSLGGLLAPLSLSCLGLEGSASLLGFRSVATSEADKISIPDGYTSQVIAAWGEPVGIANANPAFREDASNTAADQEVQLGMHHDGLQYFPLEGSKRGLLAINHEYTDDGLLHVGGTRVWSAEKAHKAQAAHGVSVIEVSKESGYWKIVRPSDRARRITANTPIDLTGPAAGHTLMMTLADPTGSRVLGTLGNCASGATPWGTLLTCEESFADYFSGPDSPNAHERRWNLLKGGGGFRWHEFDDRFDVAKHANEPNRFGWVVEIDPFDPTMVPVKRTALGRAAHEGATVAVTRDGRAVVYSGEDSNFEYIYKFVSRDRIRAGGLRANAQLLDHGILYVARFDADGSGQWLPLVHGRGLLTAANGFADQGEVVIKARQASDLLQATRMDRPEWIAVSHDGWAFCSLTNNNLRSSGGGHSIDAANPRVKNSMGNIIRWKDEGDFDGTSFSWDHFVFAGDPGNARPDARGNVKGDLFACPDGLWIDSRGVLWIRTDMAISDIGSGEYVRMGNNAMLAADVRTGEVRRFFVGPRGAEITGVAGTPDGSTMFVNIQHPGETATGLSNPDQPRAVSNWPDYRSSGRPRSATVVIQRTDHAAIGT